MRRALLAALVLALAAVPVAASAKVVELGDQNRPLIAPTCPATTTPTNCTIILTEVTSIETVATGVSYPTTVKQAGELVAFTLGLSGLSSDRKTARSEIHSLDSLYGGVPEAGIAVLKQTGKKSQRRYRLIAQGPLEHLIPYLGQVVQFPLTTPIAVAKGDVIAVSVKSWAPILSINLPAGSYAYRQGRTGHCKSASTSGPQRMGHTIAYNCNYAGTRAEYAATEITTPTQTPNYVHAVDFGP
jgi:hypothetical protein